MFIELHRRDDGMPISVNTDMVGTFSPTENQGTALDFPHYDTYVYVMESYYQIKSMLMNTRPVEADVGYEDKSLDELQEKLWRIANKKNGGSSDVV